MGFTHAAQGISATPLRALRAAVLDTETTGLDVQSDELIEIGALRIDAAKVDLDDHYQALIDPGRSVAGPSQEIHGISDEDLKDAPALNDVIDPFLDWLDGQVILGYAIEFDMAMFEKSFAQMGREWRAPRCLDVRDLVMLLRPNLPDLSLETVATWLNVSTKDRHRALSDARMTAEVFVALLPMLQKRGVTTLAEAERAASALNENQAAVLYQRPAEQAPERVDSFAYRHRVYEVMRSPAVVLPAHTSLSKAIAAMQNHRISSVFVEHAAEFGVLRDGDILRALMEYDAKALTQQIGKLAHYPLLSIEKSEHLYRALHLFQETDARVIGVIDARGLVVGALSPKDLLGQRVEDDSSFDRDLRNATSREELGRIWPRLVHLCRALMVENVDARAIASVISRELQAVTKRACELASDEMQAEGQGEAPCGFVMLVLGSGGRGESMLAMDQDNAIIYEDTDQNEDNDIWFAAFGQKVADILNDVGVRYCDGGIMGSEAKWRRPLSNWRHEVSDWITRSQPQDIMHCDIFFDAVGVYGDLQLHRRLRAEAIELAGAAPLFLKAMAMNASDFQAPLGFLGRIKTLDGRVDLKIGGIMPIFSTARVLALRAKAAVRATPLRLETAKELMPEHETRLKDFDVAHRVMIRLILAQQLRDIRAGVKLSNKVDLREVSGADRAELQWALKVVQDTPSLLDVPTGLRA